MTQGTSIFLMDRPEIIQRIVGFAVKNAKLLKNFRRLARMPRIFAITSTHYIQIYLRRRFGSDSETLLNQLSIYRIVQPETRSFASCGMFKANRSRSIFRAPRDTPLGCLR